MEKQDVYIQGVDLATDDQQAPPGTARVIRNMYPTGTAGRPHWKPIADALVYLDLTPDTCKGFSGWHRSNYPPLFVYLRSKATSDKDRLVYREMDEAGTLVGDEQLLVELDDMVDTRVVSFAQVGEHMVACITNGEQANLLFVLSTQQSAVVCFPFNLPISPVVTISQGNDVGDGNYVYAIRFTFELLDGSYHRITEPVIRTLNENNAYNINFVSAAVNASYKNLIKGVAILVSVPQRSIEDVLLKATYHKIGLIDPFTAPRTYTFALPSINGNPAQVESVAAFELFEEDTLVSHTILGTSVHSYNRALMLGGASYNFAIPTAAVQESGQLTHNPPLQVQRDDVSVGGGGNGSTFAVVTNLQWRSPAGSLRIAFHARLRVYSNPGLQIYVEPYGWINVSSAYIEIPMGLVRTVDVVAGEVGQLQLTMNLPGCDGIAVYGHFRFSLDDIADARFELEVKGKMLYETGESPFAQFIDPTPLGGG